MGIPGRYTGHTRLATLTPRIVLLALVAACLGQAPAEREGMTADATLLRQAGIGTDGPALLAFFRSHTLTPATRQRVQALVRQLGDASFRVRERAGRDLVQLGRTAAPSLREALRDNDPEIVRRAGDCLRRIEGDGSTAVTAAAARLLAQLNPAEAVAVLLDYIPSASNTQEGEDVLQAVATIALHNGKPDPTLLRALSDPDPVRRGAAAEALARAPGGSLQPELGRLLRDPEPSVRLRVALALAGAKQRQAVPVLIDLLAELPPEQSWPAEDLLVRLAGDQAPAVSVGPDAGQRKQVRDAWAGWWAAHGASLDMARTEGAGQLGYTMVVLLDAGRLLEVDRGSRIRWQMDGIQFPLDAQWLPGGRVLVTENHGNRVTERTTKGEIVWEKQIEEPIMAQRLPSGRTFIATQSRLLEVDRAGKEVWSLPRPGGDVMKALKLRNGDVAFITLGHEFIRMDSRGQVIQQFPAHLGFYGGRLDVLANGNVVVPEAENNRVVEYDTHGKIVWQQALDQPVAAVRLPNGNTLVTQYGKHRGVEIDKNGHEVWAYQTNQRVTRLFRR